MARGQLILDRYEPLGTAGAGGFGTVSIAWDVRIQRKVAIKTIELSEIDAYRAGLPGADAVRATDSTANRWHGVQPWNEFLDESGEGWPESEPFQGGNGSDGQPEEEPACGEVAQGEPITSLAHLPGLDEARTAAKLTDSRIVGVYDFEVRGQVAYLIMEYVEGITLTQLLAGYESYLTLDVVAAVFDAVAGALSVAHKAGVLHLDIKPDNILINADGQVKVTDFGLATLADASGVGMAGGGTIGYMPLEQMRREPLDVRTDEWSLASVAYEMLTGDNPFHAASLADAEKAIEDAELILPSLCWDEVDEQIDDVIFYALDPDRDQRYDSVVDFAEELDKFLGDARAGKRQLSAVVEDALGVYEDVEPEPADEPDELRKPGVATRFGLGVGGWLGERFSGRWFWLAGRLVIAALSAYLGFFAALQVYGIAPLFGRDAATVVAVVAAVIAAVVGVAWPPVGVLVTGVLVGFSFAVADLPFVAAAIAVASFVWWYARLRISVAEHPILLRVIGAILAALLVAAIVLFPVPSDYLAPAVITVAVIAVNAILL